ASSRRHSSQAVRLKKAGAAPGKDGSPMLGQKSTKLPRFGHSGCSAGISFAFVIVVPAVSPFGRPNVGFGGCFNESTEQLIILADEEVCEWRGMHGHGSRRNRRLSCGSAGRAVNVWRTSRERLRGGTRAASIGSWLAMEGLLQRHAGGLW